MPTWIAATCPKSRATGFTLIELSLVVFIVGLLLVIAIPRLGDLGGARLDTSAKRLTALIRYLYAEAALRSRVYRLNYDLDQRRYWVSVLTASQTGMEFVADSNLLTRPVDLPPTVRFADVQVPQAGRVSSGQVHTHFYPHGDTDPTIIHLRNQHARFMTVTIPPVGGEPALSEGYVDGFVQRF